MLRSERLTLGLAVPLGLALSFALVSGPTADAASRTAKKPAAAKTADRNGTAKKTPAKKSPAAKSANKETAAATPPVPLLWKVSDIDNELYLLGSFHLLKSDDYPLSPEIGEALADAEEVVFEVSPAEMGSPELGLKMGQAAARTNGKPLEADLPPATAQQLDQWATENAEVLRTMGIPQPRLLQVFDAWFVSLTVSIVEMTKIGLDPKLGLDLHIAGKASEAKKKTDGLELGSEQIAFFEGMSASEQLQMLDESLSMTGDGVKETAELHRAWRNGDVETLLRVMNLEMRKEYPQLYKRLLVARNDAWVPKLERRLKQDSTDDTLVVVGAAHLLGEDGVVEKLRAKGYKVERICAACAAQPQAGGK